MAAYQIRDEHFGLALYEASSAREALLDYFADRRRGELRQAVEDEDGDAVVVVDGVRYRAVPAEASALERRG